MSLEKQLAMNFNVLPMEIIYIIKEFAFMEQTMAFIRMKKRELNQLIENAVYSRKNTSAWVSHDSETWIFGIYYKDMTYFQLESGNCADCGQYFINNSPKLTCQC
uniref:Uncharacterized protein n=1 Tax=viral metagenome TaxID=1070528 RepID=A0A6C0B8F1_9ZZZZ